MLVVMSVKDKWLHSTKHLHSETFVLNCVIFMFRSGGLSNTEKKSGARTAPPLEPIHGSWLSSTRGMIIKEKTAPTSKVAPLSKMAPGWSRIGSTFFSVNRGLLPSLPNTCILHSLQDLAQTWNTKIWDFWHYAPCLWPIVITFLSTAKRGR